MATHDYVISNASGASVRADLNNALAAIVSNNSNATSPATTYAYQWWADTTTGQLKLRNSANSAWITIFELDGTMLMEDGTVSAPGLAFASDLNTGFFRSAADKINFATGGAERLEIGSSEVVFNDPSNDVDFRVESNSNTHMLFVDAGNDRVGINTSAPGTKLDILVNTFSDDSTKIATSFRNNQTSGVYAAFQNATTGTAFGDGLHIGLTNVSNGIIDLKETKDLQISVAGSERARIDSSGRLLVGLTTARSNIYGQTHDMQLERAANRSRFALISGNANESSPEFAFAKHRGTSVGANTAVQDNDELGVVRFTGADGTNFIQGANIGAFVDGTPGTNDMPSRLTFGTTADGASSPTTRMTIDSSGQVGIGLTNPSNQLELANGDTTIRLNATAGGNAFLKFLSNTGNNNYINFGDTDDDDIGSIVYVHSDNSLRFTANASEKMRILSGGGLTFNGDTAAANALDDYEEGSFTPVLSGSSGFPAHTTQSGHYTKVGRLVHCRIHMTISSKNTLSGNLKVSGLPFTVSNIDASTSLDFGGFMNYFANTSATAYFISISPEGGQTEGQIYFRGTNNQMDPLSTGNINNDFTFRASLIYYV